MGKFAIIVPNLLNSPSTNITATSEASSSLADGNLALDDLWKKWRSSSLNTTATGVVGFVSGDPTLYARAAALVGTNLLTGNAEVRMLLVDQGLDLPFTDEILPTSTVSSSDVTGTHADVDEGSSLDGNTVVQTAATGNISLGFPTPAITPEPGARNQCFRVYAHMNDSTEGSAVHRRGSITVYLDESGVEVANLGTKYVDGTTPRQYFFSWDAAELSTASGANVEVRIVMNQGASSNNVHLDAVIWDWEGERVSSNGGVVADSGWFVTPAGPTSGIIAGFNIDLNYRPVYSTPHCDVFYDFGGDDSVGRDVWSFTRLYVAIREDFSPPQDINPVLDPAGWPHRPSPPPTYVEAGRLVVGPLWTPAIEQAHGEYLSYVSLDENITTDGGVVGGVKRPSLRRLKVSLPFLTINEMVYLQSIYEAHTTRSPFYATLSPSESVDIFAQGWFRFEAAPSFGRKAHGDYHGSAEFVLIEHR